jgi:hypothetical protein
MCDTHTIQEHTRELAPMRAHMHMHAIIEILALLDPIIEDSERT